MGMALLGMVTILPSSSRITIDTKEIEGPTWLKLTLLGTLVFIPPPTPPLKKALSSS